jgi:rhamnosyl/mannosyltransferase
MSFGKPVINTSLDSGVPFVSIHNKTGLTVAPKSAEAIAQAINYLVENPTIREKFGIAAKERAEVEFSPSLMAERTCKLYRTILEE